MIELKEHHGGWHLTEHFGGYTLSIIAGPYAYSTPCSYLPDIEMYTYVEVAVIDPHGEFTRELMPELFDCDDVASVTWRQVNQLRNALRAYSNQNKNN